MQHVNHLVPNLMQTLHPHDLAALVSISSLLHSKLYWEKWNNELDRIQWRPRHILMLPFKVESLLPVTSRRESTDQAIV